MLSTTSDTEVILYAYMHYGADFVEKLNGIFAIAIWDDALQKLFLFRDRVGVKPLFMLRQTTLLSSVQSQKPVSSTLILNRK